MKMACQLIIVAFMAANGLYSLLSDTCMADNRYYGRLYGLIAIVAFMSSAVAVLYGAGAFSELAP